MENKQETVGGFSLYVKRCMWCNVFVCIVALISLAIVDSTNSSTLIIIFGSITIGLMLFALADLIFVNKVKNIKKTPTAIIVLMIIINIPVSIFYLICEITFLHDIWF